MIHDVFLQFAKNQRPGNVTISAGDSYPLPGGANPPLTLDLLTIMDKADGEVLTARFDIITAFTSADAGIQSSFMVNVYDNADAVANANTVYLCRSGQLLLADMIPGKFIELQIPRAYNRGATLLPAIGRYMALTMFINTAIAPGSPLFTAGGLDAFIMLDTTGSEKLVYPGGFVVQ